MSIYKCESFKSRQFEQRLKDYHINLNGFIKLLNMWAEMSSTDRGECIDKLSRKD